jgi:hypothetical protein
VTRLVYDFRRGFSLLLTNREAAKGVIDRNQMARPAVFGVHWRRKRSNVSAMMRYPVSVGVIISIAGIELEPSNLLLQLRQQIYVGNTMIPAESLTLALIVRSLIHALAAPNGSSVN